MPERFFNPEAQATMALEKILKATVKLASSSNYRREQLVAVGFKKDSISAVPMPEDEENKIQEIYKKAGYGRGISAEIAAAKVAFLVRTSQPEDLVIGMDTLPIFFGAEPKGQLFPPELFSKPKTQEEAKSMTRAIFEKIVAGYQNFLWIARKAHLPEDPYSYDENQENGNGDSSEDNRLVGSYLLLGNYRSAIARVETGVAIRFPNAKKIDSFVSSVNLMPTTLYRIAQGSDSEVQKKSLNDLAERVSNLMDQKALSITGGINWADERLRELLGIKEFRFFDEGKNIEKGVYFGAPQEAIKDFLRAKVKKDLK